MGWGGKGKMEMDPWSVMMMMKGCGGGGGGWSPMQWGGGGGCKGKGKGKARKADPKKVYVGGIGDVLAEDIIRAYFEQLGGVEEVRLVNDTDGKCKGFCFVTFGSEEDAKKVLEKEEHEIGGIKVDVKPQGSPDRGKWNGGGGGGPSGPDLERTRVSDTPATGEVFSWKGQFGWIKPSEPVDHPMARKHKGDLYAHKKDLVGGIEELKKGQLVQFFIFSDASGLGAEEISVTGEAAAEAPAAEAEAAAETPE